MKSPCIGACSTVFGDNICRGCKRFFFEVNSWNSFSDKQQEAVYRRLRALRALVLEEMLLITDTDKLIQAIEKIGVSTGPSDTDLEKAHNLLRRAASSMQSLGDCGFLTRGDACMDSPVELFRRIEDAFYRLSEAHYERYFAHDRVLRF